MDYRGQIERILKKARVHVVLTGLVLLQASALAQKGSPHLHPIVQDSKLGFINSLGRIVIKPQFENYECTGMGERLPQFGEGLAPVQVHGGYGYIEKSGKLVFALPPRFMDPHPFHEGVAVARIYNSPMPDQWAWYDRRGRILHLDQAGPGEFHEGLMSLPSGQFWGYVDHSFQWAIPPSYHHVKDFSEGLALVDWNTDSWSFIDKMGNVVIRNDKRHATEYARSFSDGYTNLDIGDGQTYYEFLDHAGKVVIGPAQVSATDFHEGYAFVYLASGGIAIMDGRGRQRLLAGLSFREAENAQFHEGLAAVSDGTHYGYINYDGRWIISPAFDYALGFSDGLAEVEWRQKNPHEWGYINRRGVVVWKGIDQCHNPPFAPPTP
jgi:hypothetical protein